MISRTTATAVGEAYAREGSDHELREWLAALDVPEWTERFAPSPSDLLALLEYARQPGSDAVSRLLAGDELTFALAGALVEREVPVTIRAAGPDTDAVRLALWSGERQLSFVPAEYLAGLIAARRSASRSDAP